MIASLADAWAWYESAKKLTLVMKQLAPHWDNLDWEGEMGRKNRLRALGASEIVARSDLVLDNLNDFCVLLLFSVFEALVRECALVDIEAEILPRHPAVRHAITTLKDSIEHGSFFQVLESYKALDPDLVEQV